MREGDSCVRLLPKATIMKSLLGKVCLVVYSFSSTALLSAACVTSTSSPGCVHYAFKTAPYNDQYTYSPSATQQQWFQNHVFRILGYEGYWNSRLSWFPNSWFYRDISALYNGDSVVAQHPEWVLHDQYGSPVYILSLIHI